VSTPENEIEATEVLTADADAVDAADVDIADTTEADPADADADETPTADEAVGEEVAEEGVTEEPAEVDPVGELRKQLRRAPGDWYVIHSYAGYENKVKASLQERIKNGEQSKSAQGAYRVGARAEGSNDRRERRQIWAADDAARAAKGLEPRGRIHFKLTEERDDSGGSHHA